MKDTTRYQLNQGSRKNGSSFWRDASKKRHYVNGNWSQKKRRLCHLILWLWKLFLLLMIVYVRKNTILPNCLLPLRGTFRWCRQEAQVLQEKLSFLQKAFVFRKFFHLQDFSKHVTLTVKHFFWQITANFSNARNFMSYEDLFYAWNKFSD